MESKDMNNPDLDNVSDVHVEEEEVEDKASESSPDRFLKNNNFVEGLYSPQDDFDRNFQEISEKVESESYKNFSQNEVQDNEKIPKKNMRNNYMLTLDVEEEYKDEYFIPQEEEGLYIQPKTQKTQSTKHLIKQPSGEFGFPKKQMDNSYNPELVFYTDNDDKNNITGKQLIPPVSSKVQDEVFQQEDIVAADNVQENINDIRNDRPNNTGFFQKHKKKILISSGIIMALIIALVLGMILPKILKKLQNDNGSNIFDPFSSDPILSKFITIDPVSHNAKIKYPISKEQYLAAIKSPYLTTVPLNFELNEECNYTVNITFKVESDSLKDSPINGKDQNLKYNATFYTTNIQQNKFSVVTFFTQAQEDSDDDGDDDDSDTNAQIDDTNSDFLNEEKSYYVNLTSSSIQEDVDFDSLSDEEAIKYLQLSMKIAKCDITFYGKITQCSFISNMTYADQNLAIKLLRMYIPSLNMSHYQQQRRILPELEVDQSDLQELSGSIESTDEGISHQSQTDDQKDDGSLKQQMVDDSDHVLDLDSGKIASSSKSEDFSFKPSSKEQFASNETAIKSINSKSSMTAKLLSRLILSQTEMDNKLSIFNDFSYVIIQEPEQTLKSVSGAETDFSQYDSFSNDTRRLLNGRDLGSSFDQLTQKLFNMNVLVLTMTGGFGFVCQTDNDCSAGLYIDVKNIKQFWPVYKQVNARLGTTLREYRYAKIVFQKNIELMKSLTDNLQSSIDLLVTDNFNTLNQELNKFYKPILDAEAAVGNYTTNVLKNAVSLSESLDISTSMNDVINQYMVKNIQYFIGNVESDINFITTGFEEELYDQQIYITTPGKKFTKDEVKALQTQKNLVLSIFDGICDKFDSGWDSYMSSTVNVFAQMQSKITSIKSASGFSTDLKTYLDLVFQTVLDAFSTLSNPLKTSFSNVKDGIRIQVHLYHAAQRQQIEAQLDSMIDYMSSQEETGYDNIPTLNYTRLYNYIELINVKNDVDFVSQDFFVGLIKETETVIVRDVYKTIDILKDIASLSNEKTLFMNIATSFNQEVQQINKTISLNLTQIGSNTYNKFSSVFQSISKDLQSLPANIDKQFNDKTALTTPTGALDLNKEMKEIKQMISDMNSIMDDFSSLADVQDLIATYISNIQKNFKYVADTSDRIEAKFNTMITEIKAIELKFKITITKPTNPFKFKKNDFLVLAKALENLVKDYAIKMATDKVKEIGKKYGSTFITSLQTKLDAKIAKVLPYTQKTVIYNIKKTQEVALFQGYLPLPIGSALVQVVQQFTAQFSFYFDMKSGNFLLAADATANYGYACRMAWDLYIIKSGISIGATLFGGKLVTNVGIQLSAFTPTLFMNSFVYFEVLTIRTAIIYQYLKIQFKRRCWGKRWYRICIWYPALSWSPWITITSFNQLVGKSYQKQLLDKKITLKLT